MISSARRLAVVMAAASALAAAGAPALAAPVNSPRTEAFPINCPGVGEIMIVPPPGNGSFTPGFVVGTHQLLIPYEFDYTATDVDGNVVESGMSMKKAPIPAGAIVCTLSGSDGNVSFTLVVTGVVRGEP